MEGEFYYFRPNEGYRFKRLAEIEIERSEFLINGLSHLKEVLKEFENEKFTRDTAYEIDKILFPDKSLILFFHESQCPKCAMFNVYFKNMDINIDDLDYYDKKRIILLSYDENKLQFRIYSSVKDGTLYVEDAVQEHIHPIIKEKQSYVEQLKDAIEKYDEYINMNEEMRERLKEYKEKMNPLFRIV